MTAKMPPSEVPEELTESAAKKIREFRKTDMPSEMLAAHILADALPQYIELLHYGSISE